MTLVKETVKIINKRGLHARASARLAREANAIGTPIFVEKDGSRVTATSIMGLMMLGAAKGDSVTILSEGDGAKEAVSQLAGVISDRFGEPE